MNCRKFNLGFLPYWILDISQGERGRKRERGGRNWLTIYFIDWIKKLFSATIDFLMKRINIFFLQMKDGKEVQQMINNPVRFYENLIWWNLFQVSGGDWGAWGQRIKDKKIWFKENLIFTDFSGWVVGRWGAANYQQSKWFKEIEFIRFGEIFPIE